MTKTVNSPKKTDVPIKSSDQERINAIVDRELYKQFRIQAIKEERTVQSLLQEAMIAYLNKKGSSKA